MLWCLMEKDTRPFPVTAPIGMRIGELKELIREKGVRVDDPLLAKDLTLWKVRYL